MSDNGKKLFADVQPLEELTLSEIGQIEADIQKEVDRELKQAAKDKLRDELRNKYKQQRGLTEGVLEVEINLPRYADRITIDGVNYLQGMTYTVRASVADVLRNVIQGAWKHQSIIDGHPDRYYRRQMQPLRPADGITRSDDLLRA
jgi:hypothetical protein